MLQLQGVFCGEFGDLARFDHDASTPLYLTIGMLIGEVGAEGADDFYATICNTDGLNAFYGKSATISLRNHILVKEFHYEDIVSYIKSILTKCPEKNWNRAANWLGRYFSWEYEDYHE